MPEKVRFTAEEPVVVSMAPPEITKDRWGPWQFVSLARDPDSRRIYVRFWTGEDSVTDLGHPKKCLETADEGLTWAEATEEDFPGILLDSGDQLKSYEPKGVDRNSIELPDPVGKTFDYKLDRTLYRADDFPEDIREWRVWRKKEGEHQWRTEQVEMNIPGATIMESNGLIVKRHIWNYRDLADGGCWAIHYFKRMVADKVARVYYACETLKSEDNGKTWHLRGSIPYHYDPKADEYGQDRMGFSEPDMTRAPDGSYVCFMRTTDFIGPGPLYVTRSTDECWTWSTPEVFDDLGCWPRVVTLPNGVTVVCYGRPGFFIRYTSDPSLGEWEERHALVPPGEISRDTCSYGDILPIDEETILVAFSDFQNFRDEKGRPRKSVVTQRIRLSV